VRTWTRVLAIVAVAVSGCKGDERPGTDAGNTEGATGLGPVGTSSGTGTGSGTEAESGSGSAGGTGSTTAPACGVGGKWANCLSAGNTACQAAVAPVCYQSSDATVGVCSLPCTNECDCFAPDPDGTAEPTCVTGLPGTEPTAGLCMLDCSTSDRFCPGGMECLAASSSGGTVYVCMWRRA
jgi:hypothetical protein